MRLLLAQATNRLATATPLSLRNGFLGAKI